MKFIKKRNLIKNILKLFLVYVLFTTLALFAIQKPDYNSTYPDSFILEKNFNDRVSLIESGEDGAKVRLELIESAQNSIDISYYTITNGKLTDAFLSLLLSAAERGVKIRILQEGMTYLTYERKELYDAFRAFEVHPNIEIKYYEKFNILTPWTWHTRLHEKVIIVDNKLALIGGRNIGDKYFFKDEYGNNFVNDREVLIYNDGFDISVIHDMKNYFDKLWDYKHTKSRRKSISNKQIVKSKITNEILRSNYLDIENTYPELFKEIDWLKRTYKADSIQFVYNPLGRLNKEPWCFNFLLNLAAQANDSILIQSPYIILSRQMQKLAKKHDIDWDKTTVLTNSKHSSPNILAISAYFNHRKKIVDTVDSVYEYQGDDSIHNKSYLFDDTISVIGTVNLDPRSTYIDTESMVVIKSDEFASQLKEQIYGQINKSALVRKDYTYGGKAKDKKPIWLFSKIVGIFDYLL